MRCSIKYGVSGIHSFFHLHLVVMLLITAPYVLGAESHAFPLWDNHESIADYAKRVNLPPTQTLDLAGGVKMELVLVPAGKFIMGTPEPEKPIVGQMMVGISLGILFVVIIVRLVRARWKRQWPQFSLALMLAMMIVASVSVWGGVRWNEALKHPDKTPDEHPAHLVTLTQAFYMGKFDVTQEQYQQLMGENPSNFTGKDNPVETVSWDNAQAFCKKLSEQTNQAVRLPTEAEWEFACRAGTTTHYYSGDSEADLARVAWYEANSMRTTHPVGQKEANAFGLYDMHGNVWQWCQDFYGKDYYGKSETENPQGLGHPRIGHPQDEFRSLRGGSWDDAPMICRSAVRFRNMQDNTSQMVACGFRVVMVPSFK